MVEEEEEEAEFCSIVCLLVSFRFVSTRWFAKVRSPLNGIEVSPRGRGEGEGERKKSLVRESCSVTIVRRPIICRRNE